MKLARVLIENFRHIERLELDFTDSLGRVRDMTVISGPNTSGKTTVLDALAIGPGCPTELQFSRPNLIWDPVRMVRHGALHTQITYSLHFSREEIETTRELFALAQESSRVPEVMEVTLIWKYPDPTGKYQKGIFIYQPRNAWPLSKGRKKVATLLSTGLVDWNWFQKVGGVFTFAQQRTGMGKMIPKDIFAIIHGSHLELEQNDRYTNDPQEILLSLAIQSLVPGTDNSKNDEFTLIQQRYNEICAPRQIKGAVRNALREFEVIFNDGQYDYRYDELSSGEQMSLLFFIRMVTEHIHQSIVLIDEIELHQHPLWQRRLLYLLPRIGTNNQFIITTHSEYLSRVVPSEAIIELGDLGVHEREDDDRQ